MPIGAQINYGQGVGTNPYGASPNPYMGMNAIGGANPFAGMNPYMSSMGGLGMIGAGMPQGMPPPTNSPWASAAGFQPGQGQMPPQGMVQSFGLGPMPPGMAPPQMPPWATQEAQTAMQQLQPAQRQQALLQALAAQQGRTPNAYGGILSGLMGGFPGQGRGPQQLPPGQAKRLAAQQMPQYRQPVRPQQARPRRFSYAGGAYTPGTASISGY